MELITILNRCHRFRGFVYQHAHFSADKKSIEVAVRPRKGSAAVCSRCHLPAPGYDQLAERRFEFIPLWGFLVFLLYTMRRVNCRRCGIVAVEEVPWGDGKRTLTSRPSAGIASLIAPSSTQTCNHITVPLGHLWVEEEPRVRLGVSDSSPWRVTR
jgi:hypothetical protein